MSKNLVLCLDGTGNRFKSVGHTNVLRLYGLLDHEQPSRQRTYYDPGLGTFSVQGAWTPWARWATRAAGLAFGLGLRQNVSEAYTFVLRQYEPGDRIYLFGFSRGAYTARVLASLIRQVGIVRAGAENMVPYIAELFLKQERTKPGDEKSERRYWQTRKDFRQTYVSQRQPGPFDSPLTHFAGLWDTVNAVAFHSAPFTRKLSHIGVVRHAVSIDERRRPYRPHLVDPTSPHEHADLQEVWFAGVHSDVGGGYDDEPRLSDISLYWMLRQAVAHGLLVRSPVPDELPEDRVLGTVHRPAPYWHMLGWRHRIVPEGALVHASVAAKIGADPKYKLRLPDSVQWVRE